MKPLVLGGGGAGTGAAATDLTATTGGCCSASSLRFLFALRRAAMTSASVLTLLRVRFMAAIVTQPRRHGLDGL